MFRALAVAVLTAGLVPVALVAQATPPAPANPVIVAHAAELAWAPAPPSLPPGAQFVLLEGNPAEAVPLTFRLKFPPNYRVPPHWHSVIEHVTVLAGTLHVGMGDQATYTGGTALSAGSFAVMPAKMVHFAWTGPDGATFQLHSIGPWSITYVNPADDPRNPKPAGGR
ncbi:MAG TPA: cupin domain-containing protein [Gemmatimonadales bacterium]|nr:cupin domain-containing protein [Gemmatimonadales bacterium]